MSSRLGALVGRAYDCIGDLTPIPADCGALCGAACCQGDDGVGMLLFPGEAVRLAGIPGFRSYRIRYMDGHAWLLTCDGSCQRHLRPLACRIFPLAPLVGADGRVTAVPDPRAAMCPLAGGEHLERRFRRAVGRAFSLLAAEPRMLAFMGRISREVEELRRLAPRGKL